MRLTHGFGLPNRFGFFFWCVLGRFAVRVVFGVVCIGDVDLMGLWLYLIEVHYRLMSPAYLLTIAIDL